MRGVVIVGAGQAAALAATQLRTLGFADPIQLFGDELWEAYERPPLSKQVLLDPAAQLTAIVAAAGYQSREISVHLNRPVIAVAPESRSITLKDGTVVGFDHLIIATGARARRLSLPGGDLPGVHYLRTFEDAEALRDALWEASCLVVVGGGFIGLEIAAVARTLGLEVLVLEQAPACLGRVIPPAAAQALIDIHLERGVHIECGKAVQAINGARRAERVLLADRTLYETDLVVVGVGSIPNDEIARAAGIHCNNGILVDRSCRTSAPRVYAIGDVAASAEGLFPGRLESWDNAEQQAMRAAADIAGTQPEAASAPWFWTDQYDHNVQMLGTPGKADVVHVRHGKRERQFVQLYTSCGVLTGAVLFNSGKDRRALAGLIGRTVDAQRIADPNVPLSQLLPAAVAH